eukprot:4375348-Amphidinium_carterae.1
MSVDLKPLVDAHERGPLTPADAEMNEDNAVQGIMHMHEDRAHERGPQSADRTHARGPQRAGP